MIAPDIVGDIRVLTLGTAGEIDNAWPFFAEGFKRSCEATGGETTAADLLTAARSGRAFMLVAVDAANTPWGAAVVQFETWASGLRLRGLGLAGRKMKGWFPQMAKAVNDLGKSGGAIAFVDRGSPGLLKNMNEAGETKVLGVLYEVKIT